MAEDIIQEVAKKIINAKNITALTGAGISAESGMPPFRGKGGIWEKFDPMEYAHIDAFMHNPAKVWNVLLKEMKVNIDNAKPNYGHYGLAALEKMGKLKTVITQNVDGLHQLAGNTDVIELHGNFVWYSCLYCDFRCEIKNIDLNKIPPKCKCGGILRPECVFFGEAVPMEGLLRANFTASKCDIMFVIGTSAVVYPAATIPIIAKESGAKIIEINPEKTPLTHNISHYFIKGKAGEVMNKIMTELQSQSIFE
ncbi:MAG: NAD-dependent deacylase [Desulfobacterales bacterium]|nr:NAD-dependent deacylase [Desulfobacterales bacterium]